MAKAEDLFVAPFDIVREKSGREVSYATWPEGVTAWLPRAECIGFTGKRSGARWFLIVSWEDVERICGPILGVVPTIDPPRFRTLTWPDAAQFERLAELAVIRSGEIPRA
jgi:hypothetical protein